MPAVAERRVDDFDPNQPRDPDGKWAEGGSSASGSAAPSLTSGDKSAPAGEWQASHYAKKGRVSLVPLAYLKSIAGNPLDDHNSQQRLESLMKSIGKEGLREPIQISIDPKANDAHDWPVNAVTEGNHRVEALIRLGHTHAPAFAQREDLFVGNLHKFKSGVDFDKNEEFTVYGSTAPDKIGIPTSAEKHDTRSDAAPKAFETPGPDLTDHEAAEGIRDGDLPSPTKFGDFWLFDLRITGTNAAYRDSIDEWAFRDPKLWLTDEFVERCNGLAVVDGHPERSGLNTEEFRQRAVGSIVLPYIKGDEVWGVAKIFDADMAQLMTTTHRSTSPGVTPPKGSEATLLEDGTKVLAEGLPLILDHLAVCEAGVWDKDGPPSGIRLDAKDAPVADEDLEKIKKERDDARAELDSMKADAARRDAEETDKEAIEAAEKEKADKAKKDAADAKKRDSRKDRHSKHDGDIMDCARCDEEERVDAAKADESEKESEEEREREDKAKRDKAKKDAAKEETVEAGRGTEEIKDSRISAMEAEIARLKRANQPLSMDEHDELAKASHRADRAYQMLGQAPPQPYPGEKPTSFRRRAANGLRPYTTSWKNYFFHDGQHAMDFNLVENAIYDEAMAYAKDPPAGTLTGLREIHDTVLGKPRVSFAGDQDVTWAPFEPPTRRIMKKLYRPQQAGLR